MQDNQIKTLLEFFLSKFDGFLASVIEFEVMLVEWLLQTTWQ
jgi:hypothetical protein